MIKSKKYYAEQVIRELQNDRINIDFKIDEREVFIRIDSVVNSLAEKNLLDNWKLNSMHAVDDQYITTWDFENAIEVKDDSQRNSKLVLPSNYADLGNNRGIDAIWPMKEGSESVKIMSQRDYRLYANTMAGNMQGKLGGYPQNGEFIFNQKDVAKRYGKKFGCRLIVRDSSWIAVDAQYPIPSNKEGMIIEMCVEWFKERRKQPTDEVRDKNDKGK